METVQSPWFQAGFTALLKGTFLGQVYVMQKNTFSSRSSSFHPLNLIVFSEIGINAEGFFKLMQVQTRVLDDTVSLKHLLLTLLNTSAPWLMVAIVDVCWSKSCIVPGTKCRPFCRHPLPSSHLFLYMTCYLPHFMILLPGPVPIEPVHGPHHLKEALTALFPLGPHLLQSLALSSAGT